MLLFGSNCRKGQLPGIRFLYRAATLESENGSSAKISSVELPSFLGVCYVASVLLGLVLSSTTRRQPNRRIIRVATAVLGTPILLFLMFLLILRFTLFREPPTLAELQRDFPSKQETLETILRMSNEDADFSRIAPTFLDRTPTSSNQFGRYMENDPKADLPERRWDEYRRIYRATGIELGIQRDTSGDAFIMVASVGLLNRGHTSGYLYCVANAPLDNSRFYPCLLNQDRGKREYSSNPRAEAYSFQRISSRWFAYDEGPS